MLSYIITESTLTVLINAVPYNIDKSHGNFDRIKEAVKADASEDTIFKLIDTAESLKVYSEGKIEVTDGEVFYNGIPIRNALTERIITMMDEGFNINGMCKFMENLYSNPSKTAVDETYLFLESCKLPITEDGHFLAYKKVNRDYKDIYSGTFDNSIGQVCQMPRNEVDDNRNNTCSAGLHFAAYSYMSSYGGTGNGDRIVIVKINPADVVSIPSDYNNAKGRTWKYEVVNEVENNGKTQVKDDCITDEEAYHKDVNMDEVNELVQEEKAILQKETAKLTKKVKQNKPVVTQEYKDVKSITVKALYSDELDVEWLLYCVNGQYSNNLDGILMKEYVTSGGMNFNQFGNRFREIAIELDMDLKELVNVVEDAIKTFEPIGKAIDPRDVPTIKEKEKEVEKVGTLTQEGFEAIDQLILDIKLGRLSCLDATQFVKDVPEDVIKFNDYNKLKAILIRQYRSGDLIIETV
jgi:hypothetical protein